MNLHEVLTRQQKTRTGLVFKRREAAGPPPSENRLLDEMLHMAAQHFDFSPLFSGDQNQARQAAQLFRQHISVIAQEVGVSEEEVKERLNTLLPFWRTAFRRFLATIRAEI